MDKGIQRTPMVEAAQVLAHCSESDLLSCSGELQM